MSAQKMLNDLSGNDHHHLTLERHDLRLDREDFEDKTNRQSDSVTVKVDLSADTAKNLDMYRNRRGRISRKAAIEIFINAGLALQTLTQRPEVPNED